MARMIRAHAAHPWARLESLGEPRAGLDMRPLRGRSGAGGGADFGSRARAAPLRLSNAD
jgi:hypothetical protein